MHNAELNDMIPRSVKNQQTTYCISGKKQTRPAYSR